MCHHLIVVSLSVVMFVFSSSCPSITSERWFLVDEALVILMACRGENLKASTGEESASKMPSDVVTGFYLERNRK